MNFRNNIRNNALIKSSPWMCTGRELTARYNFRVFSRGYACLKLDSKHFLESFVKLSAIQRERRREIL